MNPLTVAAYNEAEQRAEVGLPNRLIQACRPDVFGHVGYPTRVADDRALHRYVDVMHECRFDRDFVDWAQGLTEEEFALFRDISISVAKLTEAQFGQRVIPKAALLRALVTFRHLRFLKASPALVVEIGPGSGYLTALLGLTGYNAIATDVTQAFYVWQSMLWRHLFGEQGFVELASDPRGFADCPTTGIVHVPWWKFTVMNPSAVKLPVDIVTPNQVLCEMHGDALGYLALLCRHWFDGNKDGLVVFDGFGSSLLRSPQGVLETFNKHGMTLAFSDARIHVLETRASSIPERLAAGRSGIAATVEFAHVREFQHELAGDAIWTGDEIFWRMLYGPDHYG